VEDLLTGLTLFLVLKIGSSSSDYWKRSITALIKLIYEFVVRGLWVPILEAFSLDKALQAFEVNMTSDQFGYLLLADFIFKFFTNVFWDL